MTKIGRKRVLWLHTQPEHYFNCMMDDLGGGTGYAVGGKGGGENTQEFEWVAGFSYRGPGWYTQNAKPAVAETIFLRAMAGKDVRPPMMREDYHIDWRADLRDLDFAAVIVSGYGSETPREVMRECVRRKIPVAMWSDSNWRSQIGGGVKGSVKRLLKKQYLKGIVNRRVDSQLTANSLGVEYWRNYGVPAERIVLCPCYSDYRRVDAARLRERGEVLGKIGLRGEDRLLFTAARLVESKGIDVMIRAFVAGGFAGRGWKYVVAGVGPDEAAFKELAGTELGRSIFFVGFQQPEENLALMTQAEAVVLPSRYEPHGIVVAEALAAGTPVVASDVVGSAVDLIQEGLDGRLFKSGDAEDLSRVLKLEGFAAMRGAARLAFEKWYSVTSPMLVVPEVVRRMMKARRD